MVCKIADFIIEFKNIPPEVEGYYIDFKVDLKPEISFEITEQDIEYEIDIINGKTTRNNAVLAAFLRKLAIWVIENNAFLFHASLIDVNGTGVAFSALSGTGKTTHTLLWQQLLGDRITIVNGDKPIVRFFENQRYPIGYGTPWCGKERFGNKGSVPIKHICFIERAETNSCERIEISEILELIFLQIFIPRADKQLLSKALKLLNLLLTNVNVWKIKCNMDIEAARVAYNTIFEVEENEA